jgi:outer membrane protein OmpA-like peptidoglycan-associated protein
MRSLIAASFIVPILWMGAGAGLAQPDPTPGSPDPTKEQLAAAIRTLQFPVRDLVFTVTNLGGATSSVGGQVLDLQVKQTALEIQIDLAADVLFDFDKDTLKAAAEATLQKAAGIIRDQTKGEVSITGHTDAKGDDAYNQRLSERRAASVKAWFAKNGNLGNRSVTTQGLGEKQPVAPNNKPDGSDDPEGRQKNRRVEIKVKK